MFIRIKKKMYIFLTWGLVDWRLFDFDFGPRFVLVCYFILFAIFFFVVVVVVCVFLKKEKKKCNYFVFADQRTIRQDWSN